MFNKILAAVASIAMVTSPVSARVEGGTYDLIKLVQANGIPVTFNGAECSSGEYLGVYIHSGLRRRIELCPGATVDADDHYVVRHEVWHAIQHCVNASRGTHVSSPINQDHADLLSDATNVLGADYIENIKRIYPKQKWLLEIEAFMAMEIFTAEDLSGYFKQACTFEA